VSCDGVKRSEKSHAGFEPNPDGVATLKKRSVDSTVRA